ncbi:MAG: hypothetical protein NVS2B5_26310 [Beijerinckiaceae bacterium]
MSEADALARKHPISNFSLDALTVGAAKLRPDRQALAEAGPGADSLALTYREFDRQVATLAHKFVELGLQPGERILLVTGARTACVVATIAAVSAGLEPVLAPIGLDATQLSAVAQESGCVALAGPVSYGALSLEDVLFEAAAASETIRLVATLGPGEADGAIDLAPSRLQADADMRPLAAPSQRPRIATLDPARQPIFHEQSALLAAGLDFVGKAEIGAGLPLISTLAPASLASLVTGPVASLLSGAPLTFFGPFDAAAFLALLDRAGIAHCVVPASILPDIEEAGLFRDAVLASVVGVARDDAVIALSVGDSPLVEVRAFAEASLSVEGRAKAKRHPILSGEVLAPVLPARVAERSRR